MPAGSPRYEGQQQSYGYDYGQNLDYSGINGGDESAATILQSVKEQEAQFEQLTRELEAERQSVANQLEKCKFGSETASMSSISSTDESFKWKPPQLHEQIEEESDSESRVSGSHLVDSCLKVLQGRGLMGNIGDDPSEYLPPQNKSTSDQHNPPNNNMNEPASFMPPAIPRYDDATVNAAPQQYNNYAPYQQNSPNQSPLQSSQRTVTSITRTTTYHSGNQGDAPSPRDTSGYSQQQQYGYQGDQDANRFQSDPDIGPQGSMSYLPNPQHYPDTTQLHDGYQGLRFVEREPVARVNNDYPESPYESLQKDERTDSFDQQFSYRDDSQLGPNSYPQDRYGDPNQPQVVMPADRPQGSSHYESRQVETEQFIQHSMTERDQYGGREPQNNDSFRNNQAPPDPNPYGDGGNYGYRGAEEDRYSDRYNDSFNGQPPPPPNRGPDPNYRPEEDSGSMPPLNQDPRYRDSPQASPRPDVYPGDSNKQYPQDGPPYGQLPYGDIQAHSPTGSDMRGNQQYGESVVVESMQRVTIQEQQTLQQQHHQQQYSPNDGESRGLMPPFTDDRNPFGVDNGQPPYDDRQDSMRESEPYSSRQNSMREPGPYTGERPYVVDGQQGDIYGSRQNSMRDIPRGDPYGSRQDSIRNLGIHVVEERQGSMRDMNDVPPNYGSQQLGSPFDGEPPLAQGSQDPLAPPFNPAGSQSRLNRSMSNQGSQLRLGPPGSEKGSMQRLPNTPYDNRGYDGEDIPPRQESMKLAGVPPDGGYDLGMLRKTPSINSQNMAIFGDQRFRDPDLPEVIEYLSHPSNAIKANAAAYLQHLCFNNDDVKSRTRNLGGIPALVELVKNEIPEVHRASCGSLRNLSYGRNNDENKRAIRNAGGIQDLVRLLRKSPDNDVRELVTGILWNLSSCHDLKRPIIDEGLSTIVNTVVIPHAQHDGNQGYDPYRQQDTYWPTVFRNASGVLRNVSSEGEYARKKLRECEGLVDSILFIVKTAIGKNDIDNKSVENCVCILRNLSYACQEVQDPEYLARREKQAKAAAKGDTTGCFGGKSNKKAKQDKKGQNNNPPLQTYQSKRRPGEPVRGMELLWQPEVFHVYQPLLSECTNPETLEAAAGAIQNLAACDWQPSADIRTQVRKEKAMPILVELLKLEADRVVCASATALRNLALDPKNKELIGKYAMGDLVGKLPSNDPAKQTEYPVSDETICAVESTLYEVIKSNSEHARTLLTQGGVEKLMYITHTRHKFSPKVVKFASSLLYAMWQFKELHPEYKKRGWKEPDFITKTMAAKSSHANGDPTTPNNTLNRPAMTVGQPVYNQNTLPAVSRPPMAQHNNLMYTESAQNTPNLNNRYGAAPQQVESYQMQPLGGSSRDLQQTGIPGGGAGGVPPSHNHSYYPSVDSRGSGGERQDSSRYPQDQYPQHPDSLGDEGPYDSPHTRPGGPPSDQDPYPRGPPSEQGSNYHQQQQPNPGMMDPYSRGGPGSEHGGSNAHLHPNADPYGRGSEHGGSNFQLNQPPPQDGYHMGPPSEQGSYRPNPNSVDPYGRPSEQGSFRNNPPPTSGQDSFRNPPESYTHSGPPSEHGSYRPPHPQHQHHPSQDSLTPRGGGGGDYPNDDWHQRAPSDIGGGNVGAGYGEDPYGQLRHYEDDGDGLRPGGNAPYPGEQDRFQDDSRFQRELNNSLEPTRGDFVPAGAVPLFPMNHAGSRDLVTHDPNNEPLYAKVVKENKRRTDNYSSDRAGAPPSNGGGGQGADSWV